MFCHYRRSAPATETRDKMCFCCRHARNTWSGSARHPGACYSSATVLLSICYHIGLPDCRLLPSCYSFAIELLLLPFCAPSPRHVSDVYIAAPQGCPFRIPIIFVRHASEINGLPLCPGYAMPDGLANASRPHSKLRTRSPLCGKFSAGNPPLVPASARNCPPFIRVHSHAGAQKSSGAFFRVSDWERCRKRPARVRSALRASQVVRARDVMVNHASAPCTYCGR